MTDRLRLVLREASIADSDFVFETHEQTMRDYVDRVWGWNQESQRASHDRTHPAPGTHVVERNGEPIGVVQYEERDRALWIGRLEIHPEWQGHGQGADVVAYVCERAAEQGLPARLRVLDVNVGAQRFYERLGFRQLEVVSPHVYMQKD